MPTHSIFTPRRFDRGSHAPLYAQVKALVEQAVEAGDLKAGEAIPGERAVAELLRVSRVTIRRAFSELVEAGLLVQKRGSGTVVKALRPRFEQALSRLSSFSEDMKLRGLRTEARWLTRGTGPATAEEMMKLVLRRGEKVSRLKRLRLADGEPMAVELAVIPHRFLPDPKVVAGSLYAALAARGARPIQAQQRLHAVALAPAEARLLGLPKGAPALFIERISQLSDGRIVEFTRSHYRGDRYDFVAELLLATGEQR